MQEGRQEGGQEEEEDGGEEETEQGGKEGGYQEEQVGWQKKEEERGLGMRRLRRRRRRQAEWRQVQGGVGRRRRVWQGLTLVHFSAERKRFSWDTLGTLIKWRVINRHKLNPKRLTDQNGLG